MKQLSLFLLCVTAGSLVAVMPPGFLSAQASRPDSCYVTTPTESSRAHRNETKEVTETRCFPLARSDCGQTERLCSNRAEPDFRRKKGRWE